MGHVKGVGGFFFRARDPDGLNAWYRERLGVGAGCSADAAGPVEEWSWSTAAGPLVFAPFKADSDYFPADRQYMLNLRVDDLDAVLAPFREAGEEIIIKEEWDDPAVGRFARVHDPEGNPIELWEPPASS
ncbi:VOC family protein [Sphingopyxis indica]|uniref:VOC family protein n=1 Tax=Sphingopyxis indica TaxID=436663 RepID=UPI002938E4FD|nr:VOC family protein [Sphingopyxis indica]WOF44076.1 VOC family protein [Sphingopyxis indica]